MTTPYFTDDVVTIHHGDCRDPQFAGVLASANALVTDPPYGYAYASKRGGQFDRQPIENDDDTTARDELLAMWGDLRVALVFGSWKRPRPAGTRNVLVWDKNIDGNRYPGMGSLFDPWGSSHEEVYVINPWPHGGVRRTGPGERHPSVLRYAPPAPGKMHHPNEKPVPLMRDLLSKLPTDAVVVDPFMGSGSTLVAAQQLGIRAIGFDIDRKWCDVARDRLAAAPLFTTEAHA